MVFDLYNPQQLELFERPRLTLDQLEQEASAIFRLYWHIRNVRKNRHGRARLRHYYREVAKIKKRLLLAGVGKDEILSYLRHCRLKCRGKPSCKYCAEKGF
jgi:DNA-binding transcriptional regulator/RsmH inhibitor MraZ